MLFLAGSLPFTCYIEAKKSDHAFMLGRQKLHEKLRYFKHSFPNSACGTPLDLDHVNRHTLNDPDISGWLTCCIDDPQEISAFSRFPILSLDNNCPIRALFYQERLHDLGFTVAVPSIELVLPDLVKTYGPVYESRILPTRAGPVKFAVWMGDDTFEVSEELVSGYDLKSNPSLMKYNQPGAKILLFTMWERGTRPDH